MSTRPALLLGSAAVLWIALLSLEGAARAQARIPFSYKQAPLAQIIADVSRATGRTYIFDESVRGAVSVGLTRPVTEGEAIELLNAVLQMRDFAAVPTGDAWKIVPVLTGASEAPFAPAGFDADGEGVAATLVTLDNVDVSDALAALGELASSKDVVVAYPDTNSVILSGTEGRLGRFVEVLQALDAGGEVDLWVRTLRYRDAQMAVALLEAAFEDSVRAPDLQVDERTNSVLARGEGEPLERARRILDRFDRPERGLGEVHVVKVFNREAEEMAELLESLRQGGRSGGRAPSAVSDVLGRSLDSQEVLSGRDFSVVPDPATNSLLIRSDGDTFETIAGLLPQLDRTPERVAIDITFFELSNPSTLALGVNAFIPILDPEDLQDPLLFLSSGDPFSSSEGVFASITRAPLAIPFTDPETGLDFQFEIPSITSNIVARQVEVRSEVLQQPHLVVVGGEEHRIFVGDNLPIPVASTQGSNIAGATRQQIERQDVGIDVRVRPTVGAGEVVGLEIDLEFTGFVSTGDSVTQGPTLTQRRLQARLQLREGDIAVIGAGREQRTRKAVSRTPFLSDIPFLGRLFRVESTTTVDSRLLVSVEARILREGSEDIALSIRRRLGFERERSRVEGLPADPARPWALRVETRRREDDAIAIAEGLSMGGLDARIGRWSTGTSSYYDVVVVGFASIDEAGAAARELTVAGWTPRLISLRR